APGPAAPAPELPPPGDGRGEDVWGRLLAVPTLAAFQDEAERLFLLHKLAENADNVTRTAESIDTPRSNLYKKIERYALKPRRERTEAADDRRRTEAGNE
ncbi:MAG: hypothetical protein DYH06_15795, partial [Acidobacteria bacterium ACB2]|nr:hypothetical protein [Acidobacteria bacterium ACB2]